jgi:Tfp pilus assembly protein PilZ
MRERDQRAYPRFDVTYPVVLEASKGILQAKTKNMSAGGAFICCEMPHEPEDIVQLTIDLPTGVPLQMTAKVIWSADCEDEIMPSGMGVRFEL